MRKSITRSQDCLFSFNSIKATLHMKWIFNQIADWVGCFEWTWWLMMQPYFSQWLKNGQSGNQLQCYFRALGYLLIWTNNLMFQAKCNTHFFFLNVALPGWKNSFCFEVISISSQDETIWGINFTFEVQTSIPWVLLIWCSYCLIWRELSTNMTNIQLYSYEWCGSIPHQCHVNL